MQQTKKIHLRSRRIVRVVKKMRIEGGEEEASDFNSMNVLEKMKKNPAEEESHDRFNRITFWLPYVLKAVANMYLSPEVFLDDQKIGQLSYLFEENIL